MLTPHDYERQIVAARLKFPNPLTCNNDQVAAELKLKIAEFESELRLLRKHVQSDIEAIDAAGKGIVGKLVGLISSRSAAEQAKIDPYEALTTQIDVLLSQAETLKIQVAGYRHFRGPLGVPFGRSEAQHFKPPAAPRKAPTAPDDEDNSPWLDRVISSGVTAAVFCVGLLAWHILTYKAAPSPVAAPQPSAPPAFSIQPVAAPIAPATELPSPASDVHVPTAKTAGIVEGDTIAVPDENNEQEPQRKIAEAEKPKPLPPPAAPAPSYTAAPPSTPPRSIEPSGDYTATGKPIYTGERGGRFHYSESGNKVYERHKK